MMSFFAHEHFFRTIDEEKGEQSAKEQVDKDIERQVPAFGEKIEHAVDGGNGFRAFYSHHPTDDNG